MTKKDFQETKEPKEKKGGYTNYAIFADMLEFVYDYQNKRGFTLVDLCDYMTEKRKNECTRRTAERLRDAFWDLGLIEEAGKIGRQKLWRFCTDKKLGKSTALTEKEVEALFLSSGLLNTLCFKDEVKEFSSLMGKIRTAMMVEGTKEQAMTTEQIKNSIAFSFTPHVAKKCASEIMETIRQAIAGARAVEITFSDNTKKEVYPFGIIYGNDTYYLVHRHVTFNAGLKDPMKLYDLMSVVKAELKESYGNKEKIVQVEDIVQNPFGFSSETDCDVELKFSPNAAAAAKRYTFHPRNQEITDNQDGSVSVKFRTSGILELSWFLARWGHSVEVVSPADFWERAKQAQRNFEQNGCLQTVINCSVEGDE
ncbi:MAG: WYL domain-containing protein [Clostridia bacterium]|nr:WYL domain-containing protein [Clostridia bacterium]